MEDPILIICGGSYVSGKEIVALELGRGLAQSGRRVSFVTSRWHNGDFLARLRQCGIPAFVMALGFFSKTLTTKSMRMTAVQLCHWPGLLWNYRSLLRRENPASVIHTSWRSVILLNPFMRGDRDLLWLHEYIPDQPHYRRMFGWLNRRLAGFVCVSHAVALSLQRIGIDETRIRVIHNGLSDPANHAGRAVRTAAPFRIGIAGQVSSWKGHDDLLDAFDLVSQRHRVVELHIYGAAERAYKDQLVQKSVSMGIAEQVIWHDFVADRRTIFESLDVCVVPSRLNDPLPTTAIEAGFFGTPCVASRLGGLPEIITHEVNGLLVEPERPVEIAEALCRLIEHPEFRDFLAANARCRAVERFGQERFVREFLTLLEAGARP